MIIHAIRAENFMKFATLRITGIPQRGLIGIEGPNESGKSTIGEAVLFAFFGKNRASLETSVSRLIRWGADYLSVEVEFSVPERGEFLIYREIDKYGTNFVKVIDRATRAEVATGNVNVSEFLARALKFDFFEFHQSFYHDQIQSDASRDSQSSFVERMTGIAQIHDALAGLRKDNEQLEREFAHYQKDIQRNLQQIEKYDRNAAKLPELRDLARTRTGELETARAEHRRRQEECEAMRRLGDERGGAARKLEQLADEPAAALEETLTGLRGRLSGLSTGPPVERDFAEKNREDIQGEVKRLEDLLTMLRDFRGLRASYEEVGADLRGRLDPEKEGSLRAEEHRVVEELEYAARRARRAALLGGLALLAALAGGGLGGLLLSGVALGRIRAYPTAWIAVGAGGLFLILAIFGLARWVRGLGQVRGFRQEAQELAQQVEEDSRERERLDAALGGSGAGEIMRVTTLSGDLGDRRALAARGQFLRNHRALVEDGEGDYRKVLLNLARSERELRARSLKEVARLEKCVQDAEAAVKRARAELDKVESEVHECESQAQKKEALLGKNRDLQTRSQEIRSSIDLRRMSIELLDDTASSIRNRIGPALTRFMKEALPRLTRGRYRDIRVASDLAVQVFTSDKSDFLDPAELSGGTHEALNLALRLATSQAFISSRTRQSQFVFLDEPFKMMDESRVIETLEVLAHLSPELQQIFVIQPNFTETQRQKFDWMLETSVASTELVASGPHLGAEPPARAGLAAPDRAGGGPPPAAPSPAGRSAPAPASPDPHA